MAQESYYKDGKKATVNASQRQYYLDAGWSLTAPAPETAPETAPSAPIVPEAALEASPTSTPTEISTDVLDTPVTTEDIQAQVTSPIEGIQQVFGAEWQPAPIFKELGLTEQGIHGAVIVNGKTYTIGEGGRLETDDSFRERFGTDDRAGIAGEVSIEQAIALGINVGTDTILEPIIPVGPYEVWEHFRDEDKAEMDTLRTKLTTATQTLIDKLMGYGEAKTEAKDEAKEKLGVDEKDKAISDAQKVRNDLYNFYEKDIIGLMSSTMTTSHIQGKQFQLRAQRAVLIAPLDSNILIAQNAYGRAKDLLDDWSADYNESMQFQMQAAQMNINKFTGELTKEQAENLQEAQIKFDIWQADYNRNLETQGEVKKLMLMYPGAGVSIADSWEDAYKKISPFIQDEADFEQKMRDIELKTAQKALAKPYYAPSGRGGGMTDAQLRARAKELETQIDKATKQLQGGESWGSVWDSIRRQFSEEEISNEEIDHFLGGGMKAKEGPLRPGEERESVEWGWAKPGAYEEHKSKGTVQNVPRWQYDKGVRYGMTFAERDRILAGGSSSSSSSSSSSDLNYFDEDKDG